jgi:MFS family permease
LLFLANVLNTGDRGLLGVVTEQVRGELSLSDTQMSLANGLFFTVFNLVGGLFLARMIDRGNRVRILAFGIAGWSLATAATGLATDFATLALARIGVGIGEATAFPAAMSLIPDLYSAQARGRAVAVFQSSALSASSAEQSPPACWPRRSAGGPCSSGQAASASCLPS